MSNRVREELDRYSAAFEIVAVILILTLAAYLRFANLGSVPPIHSDEGTMIELATNLSLGKMQYFAVGESTLLFARPPFFAALTSLLLPFFSNPLLALRSFSAALGVLSVAMLYLLVRVSLGSAMRILAVLASGLLAIYPSAILFSRIGFSYNLLAPLVLLATFGMWRYARRRNPRYIFLAGLAIGLGTVSDLLAFVFAIPVILLTIVVQWKELIWAFVGLLVFPIGYIVLMLLTAPEAFLFDAAFTVARTTSLGLAGQLGVLITNFSLLLTGSVWFALGISGSFLLRPATWRWLILGMFIIPLIVVARTVGLVGLGEYFLIPFFPFVALGLAQFILKGAPLVVLTISEASDRFISSLSLQHGSARWVSNRARALTVASVLFLLLLLPFLFSTLHGLVALRGTLGDHLSWALVDIHAAHFAADYVNDKLEADQKSVGSPAVLWLLNGEKADFQQSVAYGGVSTVHLPANIPQDRFLFDPTFDQARFVIVDNIWRNWAAPGSADLAEMLEVVESWPLRFENGQVFVYENPEMIANDK